MRSSRPIPRALSIVALSCLFCTASRGAVEDLLVVSGPNSQVLRFDGNTGTFVGTFATDPNAGFLSGALYGPDGNLYVTNLDRQDVEQFNGTTGAFIKTFIPFQNNIPLFPHDLAFGTNNDVYVVSHTNLILQYDTSGNFVKTFASDNGLEGPTGLAFHNGQLYVASSNNNEVLRYDAAGNPTVFASGHGLNGLAALTFDAQGDLFVSNQNGNDIVEFDSSGNFVNSFSSPLLHTPIGLVFGPDGALYISSQDNNSVVRLDVSTGNFTTFASSAGNTLTQPQYLVFMPQSTAVPEPSAIALLAIGFAGVAVLGRRGRVRTAGAG